MLIILATLCGSRVGALSCPLGTSSHRWGTLQFSFSHPVNHRRGSSLPTATCCPSLSAPMRSAAGNSASPSLVFSLCAGRHKYSISFCSKGLSSPNGAERSRVICSAACRPYPPGRDGRIRRSGPESDVG